MPFSDRGEIHIFNLNPTILILNAVAFLIAGTIHEAAHAYTAYGLGDKTPLRDGRLSFNPAHHLDPLGFILVLFAGIGWARPVLTNPSQFRVDRKFGMLLVAIAGPLSNLVLAMLLIPILPYMPDGAFYLVLHQIITLNIMLATFNLLPIFPLDGEKVLRGLLPMRAQGFFYRFETWGQYLLLLIVFVPPLSALFIGVPYHFVAQLLLGFGI